MRKIENKINTKQALTDISKRMGCFRNDAYELIQKHLYDYLCENLIEGREVAIFPFGKFYLSPSKRPRRDGTRRMMVKFRASKTMVNFINNRLLEKKIEEGYLYQESVENLLPAQVEALGIKSASVKNNEGR